MGGFQFQSTFLKKKKTQNNDDSWLKKMLSISRVWNKRKSERAAGSDPISYAPSTEELRESIGETDLKNSSVTIASCLASSLDQQSQNVSLLNSLIPKFFQALVIFFVKGLGAFGGVSKNSQSLRVGLYLKDAAFICAREDLRRVGDLALTSASEETLMPKH